MNYIQLIIVFAIGSIFLNGSDVDPLRKNPFIDFKETVTFLKPVNIELKGKIFQTNYLEGDNKYTISSDFVMVLSLSGKKITVDFPNWTQTNYNKNGQDGEELQRIFTIKNNGKYWIDCQNRFGTKAEINNQSKVPAKKFTISEGLPTIIGGNSFLLGGYLIPRNIVVWESKKMSLFDYFMLKDSFLIPSVDFDDGYLTLVFNKSNSFQKIYLNKNKGYALNKYEGSVGFELEKNNIFYEVVSVEDYIFLEKINIWLPNSLKYKQTIGGKIKTEMLMQISSIKEFENQNNGDIFEMEIPLGSTIYDKRAGIVFTADEKAEIILKK